VARKQTFLGVAWSARFRESYPRLSSDRQKGADKVVLALIKQEITPGMRIKPIEPEKYYNEARINDGDRLIFRIEDDRVWFVDVVPHDEIGRYGRPVPGLF
jgi:mRNA-degrading endonuclease RelE of RelBE toxin-antitoxin system